RPGESSVRERGPQRAARRERRARERAHLTRPDGRAGHAGRRAAPCARARRAALLVGHRQLSRRARRAAKSFRGRTRAEPGAAAAADGGGVTLQSAGGKLALMHWTADDRRRTAAGTTEDGRRMALNELPS